MSPLRHVEVNRLPVLDAAMTTRPMDRVPAINVGCQTDVSIIVVNYNTAHLLERCFGALRRARQGLALQTIVVDNASQDGSVSLVRDRFPDFELIESGANVGFGRANNLAVERCKGRYILLLNTDAFVEADTVAAAVRCLDAEPKVGVVGVRLLGSDGSQQPSCRYFPTPANIFFQRTRLDRFAKGVVAVDHPNWDPGINADCDWVPGCFLMIRRSIVQRIDLFDPRFFLYCEEIDLCRRVKAAGWAIRYLASARAVHIGGESAKSAGAISEAGRQLLPLQVESQLLYFRKHHGLGGVALHLALECVACVVMVAKRLLKSRANAWQPFSELRLTYALAVRTRCGNTPTR